MIVVMKYFMVLCTVEADDATLLLVTAESGCFYKSSL